jgi:hypothetical protein
MLTSLIHPVHLLIIAFNLFGLIVGHLGAPAFTPPHWPGISPPLTLADASHSITRRHCSTGRNGAGLLPHFYVMVAPALSL